MDRRCTAFARQCAREQLKKKYYSIGCPSQLWFPNFGPLTLLIQDMALCEYYLFPNMKKKFRGKKCLG